MAIKKHYEWCPWPERGCCCAFAHPGARTGEYSQSETIESLRAQLAEKERELTDWQEGFKEMAEVMQCLSGHDLTDEQTQTVFGVLDSYLPPRTGE